MSNNRTLTTGKLASTTTRTPLHTTQPPVEDDDNNDVIIICSVVGTVVVIAILAILTYVYVKRRKQRQQHQSRQQQQRKRNSGDGKKHLASDLADDLETGQLNPGLDVSSSEIDKPPGKASTGVCIDESLTEFKDEIEADENIIHNVSIKLLTNWSDIYTMIDTAEYATMKQLVETSMENIYVSFDGFDSATLLKFRKGSVIADIQLRFFSNAVKPLSKLEKAIKCGKCADLEVDEQYFKILMPDLKTVDGFTRKGTFEVPKRNDRESGYYGGSEEDELNLHKPTKNRSTKSTQSRDSMTSEMGSSYVSSTNISINSGGEEESEGVLVYTRKKTGLLPLFSKPSKHKDDTTAIKSNLLPGRTHKVIFDFHPQSRRELKLTRGELITITEVNSSGWAKAVNGTKKEGWIPQNFVFPFDAQKDKDIKMRAEAITLLDGLKNDLDGELDSSDESEEIEGDDDDDDDDEALFITIFPFEPSEENELRLEVGDLIDVLKTDESGWWKGLCKRTEQHGWFPWSYVRPFKPNEINAVSLSDSEVMSRTGSLGDKPRDGYSSDNGHTRTKVINEETKVEEDVKEKEKESESMTVEPKKTVESAVIFRETRGGQKERAVSLIIDTNTCNMKHHSPAPLTPPPRLNDHKDHGTEKTFTEPPSKPVPPKPRQKHIEKEYHNLVASGKLGSQDSLKTVSTECLSSLGRSPHRGGSGKRRNSEEMSPSIVIKRHHESSKLHRTRPKSFQESQQSSFVYLANRFTNIKPAFSLPSLVGDQVKLSPDDDRPFLEPIPRRAKSHSLISSPSTPFPERNCSSLKDLSVVIVDASTLEPNHSPTNSENNHMVDSSQSPLTSSSASSLQQDEEHDGVQNKPLPPEPENLRPVILPKPSTNLGPMMSHLLTNQNLRQSPLISHKPSVPQRSSSKNKVALKLIEEQRSKQGLLPEHHYQPRVHVPYGRLRPHQKHFSSFESINEESEQVKTPKDEVAKLPGDYDHQRSRSEPHDRILQNEMVHFTLPPLRGEKTNINKLPINSSQPTTDSISDSPVIMLNDDKASEPLTIDSRTSSLQSLTSIASSVRSTASSTKHEQQNLRRAVIDVHGQGDNDLSFNIGAILYELRPKNKTGLCYGILDDSTQGWYPAESVEPIYFPDQHEVLKL